jgi:hypothetical protein
MRTELGIASLERLLALGRTVERLHSGRDSRSFFRRIPSNLAPVFVCVQHVPGLFASVFAPDKAFCRANRFLCIEIGVVIAVTRNLADEGEERTSKYGSGAAAPFRCTEHHVTSLIQRMASSDEIYTAVRDGSREATPGNSPFSPRGF